MSAAAISAPLPLMQEGQQFWEQLVQECRRYMQTTNTCVCRDKATDGWRIQWTDESDIYMVKAELPSTTVRLTMNYYPWGPMICGMITGREDDDLRFTPEEVEVPIAKDLDGEVVAVFDQGRSFSPHEFASYVMQHFHRCYPGLTLPC